jgi:predicted transcriptional regulator
VVVYVSSPQQAVVGSFRVDNIVEKPVTELWEEVEKLAGISHEDFYDYYQGVKLGVGIFLKDIHRFSQPVELHRLRNKLPNLKPPQSFRYLTDNQFNIVTSLGER